MNNSIVKDTQTSDWIAFTGVPDIIDLEPKHIEEAQGMSSSIKLTSRKWQLYLQSLALQGFEEWLKQRQPDLVVNSESCSISQPLFTYVIDTVFNLRVGQFKVCLIPNACFSTREVDIPRAVVELPEYAAHFYVLVSVNEDTATVGIRGFLRYDQLASYRPQCSLNEDWSYSLPLAWFNLDPNELLLNLQCLAPFAIELPAVIESPITSLTRLQEELPESLPSLDKRHLWQVLTWDQGSRLLRYPELLDWIYQVPAQTEASSLCTDFQLRLQELVKLLTRKAVNTAYWIEDRLDEVAHSFSNSQNLSFTPAPAMRWSTTEERFQNAINHRIRDDWKEMPLTVKPVYYEINQLNPKLCVCAVAWSRVHAEVDKITPASWCLMLLLGTQSGETLPGGTRLRVSNLSGVQYDESLEFASAFIYTVVEGVHGESYVTTLSLPGAAPQMLPPHTFVTGTAE